MTQPEPPTISISSNENQPIQEQPPAYAVGYKKPPEATRFKPGQSGNKKGRPKGARNQSTIVDKILDEPIAVTEKGKHRNISRREAMYKQQVNKALGGDSKAFQAIQKLDRENEEKRAAAEPSPIPLHESDVEIIRHLADRLRAPVSDQQAQSPTSADVNKRT